MSITKHNCSVFCRDCGKVVVEGASAVFKVAIGAGLPLLEGAVVTESGNHHAKFRQITGDEGTTKRHATMTLYEDDHKIGEFTTSGIAQQVGITLSDPELTTELETELRELLRDRELRRRGSSGETK